MTNISQKKLKAVKHSKNQELSLYQKLEQKLKKEKKSISGKFVDFFLKN